jgi:hypothetical protein
MDEKTLVSMLRAYGQKIYELQTGMAALYNLCVRSKIFSDGAFQDELVKVQSFPEFQKLKTLVDQFGSSTEQESLEELLQKYKGPVQ